MTVDFNTALKRVVPAAGLVAVAACLVYIPYEAVRIREGDNLIANIGYAFIWAPPSVDACMDYFDVGRRVCSIRPSILPAVITAMAVAATTAGLTLIVGLLPNRNKPSSFKERRVNYPASENIGSYAPPSESFTTENKLQPRMLADILRDDFGHDFPVSTGNAKKDDPLVITAKSDYVGCEYAVVNHVLRSLCEEFKLAKQSLISDGDRKIDELVFDVKPSGAGEWTGRRRFYFDITAGFNQLGA